MGILFLGFSGLAIDIGNLYREKRDVQTAADAGALAAAAAEASGGGITAAATAAATQNGLTVVSSTPKAGQATLTAVDGISGIGNTAYVQVTISEQTQTFFMASMGRGFSHLGVQATAQASYLTSNNNCFVALSPNGIPVPNDPNIISDVSVGGAGSISAPNCGVGACGPAAEANGSGLTADGLFAWGSANITAKYTQSPTSGTDNSGSKINSTNPTTPGCAKAPFNLKPPPISGPCAAQLSLIAYNSPTTVSPGCYNGITIGNGVPAITFKPGLYIINGPLNLGCSSGTSNLISGSGVTFYFPSSSSGLTGATNGSVCIANGLNINFTGANMTASNGTTYNNVLFYQDAANPSPVTVNGGSNESLSGNMYFPDANFSIGNGSNTQALSGAIVAQTITVVGGAHITNSYSPSGGAAGGGVTLAK